MACCDVSLPPKLAARAHISRRVLCNVRLHLRLTARQRRLRNRQRGIIRRQRACALADDRRGSG